MTDCIFCKITQKEFPPLGDAVIREDENYIARLSPFPNTPGYTIVVPKTHYDSDCLQMPDEALQEFILAAKHVSSLLLKALPDVGRIGLIMEGTGINHAHIKLSPMHGTPWMRKGEFKPLHCDRDDYFEEYPGYLTSNDGPRADDDELQELAEKIRG